MSECKCGRCTGDRVEFAEKRADSAEAALVETREWLEATRVERDRWQKEALEAQSLRDGLAQAIGAADDCGNSLPKDQAIAEALRVVSRMFEHEERADFWKKRAEEAEAAFLGCALAVGIYYAADGVALAPGPADAVIARIRSDVSAAGRVAELEVEIESANARAEEAAGHADGLAYIADDRGERIAALESALREARNALDALLADSERRTDGHPPGIEEWFAVRDCARAAITTATRALGEGE